MPTPQLIEHIWMDRYEKVMEIRLRWRYVEMAERCG